VQPTPRYWEYVALACSLGGAALLFERPLLLVGMAGLFGWLLAAESAFLFASFEFDRTLQVEHRLTEPRTLVEEPVLLAFGIEGDPQRLSVTATPRPAPGVTVGELPTAQPGETVTTTVSGRIVGEHTFQKPKLTVRGAGGLFTETLSRGPTRELVIETREPGRIHIGSGGDAVSSTFGAHTAGSGASGLIPAELREYVEEDPASRIDWNATARLASPHVREFDADAELTTLFVLDRRGRLDIGPPGETAFETLLGSALSYLAVAESLDDPVRCFTVTETEIERLTGGSEGTRTYDAVRQRLRSLTVEDGATDAATVRSQSLAQRSPTLDPTTPFGRTLRPYLRDITAVRTADPLAAAVRNGLSTRQRGTRVAIFTDDTDRVELRNAVTEARRANGRVVVFLAPRALYEPGELDDREAATDQYRSFEEFRRLLHSIPDVTAYEVAPKERIDRLLETTARNRHPRSEPEERITGDRR
jgi:uncharacterized protein (DUF58 family)